MNNSLKKRDIKSEEYNNNWHTSKRLKTQTNNQENDINITSSEIKELIKNLNLRKLKKFFNISKFYDNEFIKHLLFLYKNKTPTKNLNYEISKDKYKIILNWDKCEVFVDEFLWIDTYIIENGNKNLLKFLLKHGVDIKKIRCKDKKLLLFDECESGNRDFVEFLVENGVDINEESKNGESPLFYACRSGNKDLVEYLVEHGAVINKYNIIGKTPLFNACKNGNKDLVEYLVEHGANINKESF